jgi:hypothetical protein
MEKGIMKTCRRYDGATGYVGGNGAASKPCGEEKGPIGRLPSTQMWKPNSGIPHVVVIAGPRR